MTERRTNDEASPQRGMNWTLILLVAGLLILTGAIAYLATRGNSDQDKLTNAEIAQSTPPPSREKLCASGATSDLIKRDVFREAAQLRGHDQGTYDSLAGFAVLRIDNPVMESQDVTTGTATCSGSISIELPPGVTFENGGRSIMSDLDYHVDPNGNITLSNAGALVALLAKLVRTPPPAAPAPIDTNTVAPENEAAAVPPQPAAPPEPQAPPQPPR